MIVKDFKYIIKRIIIGVGIALVLMLIKGNLLMQVHAQEVNAVPNDILIATGSGVTTYSPSTNTWNGQTVYALPTPIIILLIIYLKSFTIIIDTS